MTVVEVASKIVPVRFLIDFKKTSDVLGASYSEFSILGTLKTFKGYFEDSTVIWRTSTETMMLWIIDYTYSSD